jgi:hypothetical protein
VSNYLLHRSTQYSPPYVPFNLLDTPDDAQSTEAEVAAVARWSTNTVAAWRRKRDHPLPWFLVGGNYVRYRAGDVKVYLAGVLRQKRARFRARGEPHQQPADHDPTAITD